MGKLLALSTGGTIIVCAVVVTIPDPALIYEVVPVDVATTNVLPVPTNKSPSSILIFPRTSRFSVGFVVPIPTLDATV